MTNAIGARITITAIVLSTGSSFAQARPVANLKETPAAQQVVAVRFVQGVGPGGTGRDATGPRCD